METSQSEVALELNFEGVGPQHAEKGEEVASAFQAKATASTKTWQHKSRGCFENMNTFVQRGFKTHDSEWQENRLKDVEESQIQKGLIYQAKQLDFFLQVGITYI